MRRPVASDLDGTFDKNPTLWSMVDIIITGNSWEQAEEVMNRWVGPKKPVYWNTTTPNGDMLSIVNFKSDMINKTKARKYYEDQSEQAKLLEILCPECEIITVPSEERTFI